MKQIIAAGILSLLLLTACKNETPVAPAEPAPVNIPPPAAPVEPVNPEVPQKGNGTSVKIGEDGMSVDTKNGNNKTSVEVKDGKAAVEIKK